MDSRPPPPPRAPAECCLRILSLPVDVKEDELVAAMSKFGPVARVTIMHPFPGAERPNPRGLVIFENAESAQTALAAHGATRQSFEAANPFDFNGHALSFRELPDARRKVFVRPVPDDVSAEQFQAEFESIIGPITDVKVFPSRQGASFTAPGFGFITFKTIDDAAKALKASGSKILGTQMSIERPQDNRSRGDGPRLGARPQVRYNRDQEGGGGYQRREGYQPREGGYQRREFQPREGGYQRREFQPREGGYAPRQDRGYSRRGDAEGAAGGYGNRRGLATWAAGAPQFRATAVSASSVSRGLITKFAKYVL